MEKLIRTADTICPHCLEKIKGSIIQEDGKVLLYRNCEKDGPTTKTLSNNPQYYADLDRFYFDHLKRGEAKGRITNYWILSTPQCNLNCDYCQAGVHKPFFVEMDRKDFDKIIEENKDIKLTISGGEPTLHPDLHYFITKATQKGRLTQLATNGLKLSDLDFVRKLKQAGVKEFRISFEFLDKEKAYSTEFHKWIDTKSQAIEYLENEHLSVSLSPTIFKGINEDVLLETLDFAKDRLFVKEISVNGFSWVGSGTVRNKEEMIMPDEMMDVICKGFRVEDRESVFTLQKAFFTLLQLMNIRICMYTQLMIFVRQKGELTLLSDFFNMKRMKKGMQFWERFSNKPYLMQFLGFGLAMLYSMNPKTLFLLKDMLWMVFVKYFRINFTRNPASILPLVLNTNCSSLTLDEDVSQQCMSGVIVKKADNPDVLTRSASTYLLIQNEIDKHRKLQP